MQNNPHHDIHHCPLPALHCGTCQRKLGEGLVARLRIKCPRCKTLNHIQGTTEQQPHP